MIVPIDLKKNPEIADLLTDMQPGQRVYACLTIRDKNDQLANLRLEEVTERAEDLPGPDEKSGDYEEEDGVDKPTEEAGAEAEGAGREQTNGSAAAPVDSAGQSGPGGG